MKKLILILALTFAGLSFNAQQVKYYLTQQNAQPWGSISNITAMNTAFGAGNWIQGWFQTVNVNALLQPSVCLIYCDGGSMAAASMNAFLLANLPAIEAWVFAGGRLFLNAAPNTGGNMNFGHGGITLNYAVGPYSAPGNGVPPFHPIYAGPALVAPTTTHTGNAFCHGYISGPGTTTIISGAAGMMWGGGPFNSNVILASKPWGAGMCLFGSMTNTSWHNPNPSAGNLRANMLTWLAVCCIQPTITAAATSTAICSGQTTTITGGGAGIGGTYTINPGGIIGNTAAVSPTINTIYTVVGTNSNNCQGTKTIQIIVNPTPTVNPGSNSAICKGSVLNLTCNASAGNPVTYNWTGPNGYTSPFQNPQVVNAQPTLTGVYFVNVTSTFSSGVCSNSGTTAVIVVNSNSIAVSDHTVCQGAPLTLTAGVLGALSCSWTGPNTYTSNVQNPPSFPAAPVNAGDYSVTATFSALGTTLTCNTGAISNVSVVATSPVTLTIPTNVCEKQNVVMTASANPAPMTYFWTGPNGFLATGTNTNITSVVPAQGGLYNVLATWAIGNVSCSVNGAAQMNVVPVPEIAVVSSTAVCYPANVSLTSSAPGAISYSWTGPNSFNSSIPNPLLTAPTASASGIYTVTTAFTNGVLICLNSNTTQVTVNPTLPFSLPPYKQLCSNSTYSMSGPAGATSYTWLAAGGYTNNNQVLIIPNMQPSNAGTYTLIANLGPCQTIGTTQLDILSPISFSLTPGNHTVCEGDSIRLIMGSSGGSQNYAYVWNPQQWLGSPTGSVQWAHPGGTTIYNVMGYDIACPAFSITTSFTITVNKGPVPQLNLTKAEGCEPLCLKLNSKTQEDATQVTYDFGNGELMQADDFTYCLNQPGTYKLKVQTKGKNGCTMNYEHPAPIVVHPNPHTELYWTPDPATTTQNNVTFLPTHQYGPVVEYGWEFAGTNGVGGYDTSSMKNPVRVYENIGKYPVLLISKTDKGCIDTVYKILEVRDEFTIYIPNTFTPNNDNLNDVFNIKGIGLKMDGYSMEIFDRWGNLVYSTKDVYKGWDGTVKGLNAENGVYVYKVKALGANGEGKKEYVGHVTLLK